MNDKDIIKKMYIELCEASQNKDKNKLNELLARDYTLTHMTGMIQTKEQYINSVMSEELKYYDSIHESIEIKIKDNSATIIDKTKILASPFGMPKSWWTLKQTITLKKVEGKWLITSSIASTY